MRKHALLQDRFSETETIRGPGVDAVDLDGDARRRGENRGRIFARTDQAKSDRMGRSAFRDNGAEIFAARRFRRGLLFAGAECIGQPVGSATDPIELETPPIAQ